MLLQFGTQPLFTSAGAIAEPVLALCGRQNVFADSRTPWPQISREQVLARQPQAIVITGARKKPPVKAFWAPQLQVPVIALNEDWFNRGGPRIALAAQLLPPIGGDPLMLVFWLDILGTAVFAVSGAAGR